MENQRFNESKKTTSTSIYFDESVDFCISPLPAGFSTESDLKNATVGLFKKSNELEIRYQAKTIVLPYSYQNAINFIENYHQEFNQPVLFDNKICPITHAPSLTSLAEKLLKNITFSNFQSIIFCYQTKGESNAFLQGITQQEKIFWQKIKAENFNVFFNHIKKSRSKIFNTNKFPELNLGFIGTFIPITLQFKWHHVIVLVSRDDFLEYSDDEKNRIEELVLFHQLIINDLITRESSLAMSQNIFFALDQFPATILVTNKDGEIIYSNQISEDVPSLWDSVITLNNGDKLFIKINDNSEVPIEIFHHERLALIGELFNTLKHELSNPLFGLSLSCELLKNDDQDEDRKKTLNEIAKNINRCQDLLHQFSHLYSSAELSAFSIEDLINEVFILGKSELKHIKKIIHLDNFSKYPVLFSKKILLTQIFFNLFINASQAMKDTPKPEINVKIAHDEKNILIDITDNGPGIPEHIADKIFQPFLTTKKSGTGLGLALSKRLIESIQGDLQIINSKQGAHFRLSLPKTCLKDDL